MTKHRKYIERLTIYGDKEERPKATQYCHDNGFRIIQAGPKTRPAGHIDYSRFKIVAEREIEADAATEE